MKIFNDSFKRSVEYLSLLIGKSLSAVLNGNSGSHPYLVCSIFSFFCKKKTGTVKIFIFAFLYNESLFFHSVDRTGNVGFILSAYLAEACRRYALGKTVHRCKINGAGALQVVLFHFICGDLVPISVNFSNGQGKLLKAFYHVFTPLRTVL